ncbi:MAG TPA: hypothetical protein EYG03_13425 [Planctomycetes bacterium]|nr:hypothetical protein [Planctomycetota bacterium]
MSLQWLERLNQATEYRDLQSVFSDIAADARSVSQSEQLAASIDEAIYRIQRESLRDEQELDALRGEYETFKRQHKAVIGWLKRHIPFTETRRREKHHTQTVSDQEAEVLADNLIIARAQMIKEQVLPPDSRRLGQDPAEWQRRLSARDDLASLSDYADVVREMDQELQNSRTFVAELDGDIDAFSGARFSDSEDQHRRDADMSAARNELAALQAEIQHEGSLRSAAIGRLSEMVSEDLAISDPSFHQLEERTSLLETASRRAKDGGKRFEDMQSNVKDMLNHAEQLEAIPEKRNKLVDKQRQLQHDEDDAQRQLSAASNTLSELAASFDRAKDRVQQGRAAVAAAKKVYQAHLAETGQVEVDPNQSSPVAEQFARTEPELETAETELRAAKRPYDTARAEVQQAELAIIDVQRRREQSRTEESRLADRDRELRDKISSCARQLTTALDRARTAINDYLVALRPIDHEPSLRELESLSSGRHYGTPQLQPASEREQDLRAAAGLYAGVIKSLKRDRKDLDHLLAADRNQRGTVWTERCRQLLDDYLADEVANGTKSWLQ